MEKIIALVFSLAMLMSCNESKPIDQAETMSMMEGKYLLFVGTYTDKEGHVDGKAEGIYGLSFNANEGTLAKTSLKVKTTNPSYLYVDEEQKQIYAVNEKVGIGETLSSFSYNHDSIIAIDTVDALGGAPCYITKIANNILTANYVGGNHAVYSVSGDGLFEDRRQVIQHEGRGKTDRQAASHAHMIIQNPHTKQVLTADLGTDKIDFYDFDMREGMLSRSYTLMLEKGAGPRHIDFHPSKDIIYIINELNGTISIAKKANANYEVVQNIESTRMGNSEKAGCADIHIHPNGKFLYASNRGPYNSISQYDIADDGALTFRGEISTNGEVPRSFTIDPSGKYLLVANQNTNNVVVFAIDQGSGNLVDTGNSISAPTPVCLKFE